MTDNQTKIAVARSKLRDIYPFFGVLAAELNITCDESGEVKTACVSKYGNMLYNSDFVQRLSFLETMGLIAHEALHVIFEFWDRLGSREPERANLAHDFVINLIISRAGLALPDGGALDVQYDNMSFEEVYDRLNGCNPRAYGLMGDVSITLGEIADKMFPYSIDKSSNTSEADLKEKWKGALMRAVKADKEEATRPIRGNLPDHIKILIDEILYPPLPFAHRLQKYIGQWGRKSKPSFRHYNKMNSFDNLHTILPAYRSNRGRVYVLIDTSGSMFYCGNNALVSHGLGCIESIATSIGMDVVMVTCDAALQQRMSLREFRQMMAQQKVQLYGGGGSDFTQAFNEIWLEISKLKGGAPIICFTDGDINCPTSHPRLKSETFWVTFPKQKAPTDAWGIHCPLDKAA